MMVIRYIYKNVDGCGPLRRAFFIGLAYPHRFRTLSADIETLIKIEIFRPIPIDVAMTTVIIEVDSKPYWRFTMRSTVSFYNMLLTDVNGITIRYIGVMFPDGSRIETQPGRNARKRLRNWVIALYGDNFRFRQCKNKAPLTSRLCGSHYPA